MQGGRYGVDIRWTGVFQKILGSEFDVIEEGLTGRTTNLDDGDKGRNGFMYFKEALRSNDYLDYIILLLGTNDLKTRFGRSAKDAAQALSLYIDYIQSYYAMVGKSVPEILVLVPPSPKEKFMPKGLGFDGAEEKASQLAGEYKKLPCKVIDLNEYISVSEVDGVHLDLESNKILAEKVSDIILTK